MNNITFNRSAAATFLKSSASTRNSRVNRPIFAYRSIFGDRSFSGYAKGISGVTLATESGVPQWEPTYIPPDGINTYRTYTVVNSYSYNGRTVTEEINYPEYWLGGATFISGSEPSQNSITTQTDSEPTSPILARPDGTDYPPTWSVDSFSANWPSIFDGQPAGSGGEVYSGGTVVETLSDLKTYSQAQGASAGDIAGYDMTTPVGQVITDMNGYFFVFADSTVSQYDLFDAVGNLIPSNAIFDGSGSYVLSGLVSGQPYLMIAGANELASPEALGPRRYAGTNLSSVFEGNYYSGWTPVGGSNSVTIYGTPRKPVTAFVCYALVWAFGVFQFDTGQKIDTASYFVGGYPGAALALNAAPNPHATNLRTMIQVPPGSSIGLYELLNSIGPQFEVLAVPATATESTRYYFSPGDVPSGYDTLAYNRLS
jgi:hypothetical protein